jgi:hypothetical protein
MPPDNQKNNSSSTPKAPDTYTHKGTQTPTYTPPPMPQVSPAKSSDSMQKN